MFLTSSLLQVKKKISSTKSIRMLQCFLRQKGMVLKKPYTRVALKSWKYDQNIALKK